MNKKKYMLKKMLYKITGKKDKVLSLTTRYLREQGAKIGEHVRFTSDISIPEPYLVEIGDKVTFSFGVSIITHDNSVGKVIEEVTDAFGRVKIGNKCFIGAGVIILPGVEIGDNVIVGSGSVVTRSFKEGNVVIAGNPAKIICSVEEYIEKSRPYGINTWGLSFEERKKIVLNNEEKFIKK